MMPDDKLREYLQSSPWLTLHDLKQEIQELRALVQPMATQPVGDAPVQPPRMSVGDQSQLSQRLHNLEKGIESLQTLINIQVAPQNILLTDASRVERLNEDERIAGWMLALCTLFVGAILQNLIISREAMTIGIGAAVCFGFFAVFYYWRSRKYWRQLHEEAQISSGFLEHNTGDRSN